MDRREFVKMLALLGAGAAAMPQQIAAFERYYEVNTPRSAGPFIALDEVSLSGLVLATSSPLFFEVLRGDEVELACGLNCFGGCYFWRAPGDGKIVAKPGWLTWRSQGPMIDNDVQLSQALSGHMKFIDWDGVRRTVIIDSMSGIIA